MRPIQGILLPLITLGILGSASHATAQINLIPDHPILDELVVAYPYGATGPMTATADGDYCYAAEGCAIALFKSDRTPPPPEVVQDNFDSPIWREPIGFQRVRPVDLRLDPEGDVLDPLDQDALLYIAAGRDGLWAMRANVDPGQPHRAFRIDDSGNLDPATQKGRKWCNSIELMTVGSGASEQTYLLALFARKNKSTLRSYRLDDLRGVVAGGSETGSEIVGSTSTLLTGNPNANGDSYGFDIAVDGRVAYVAMGYHGVVQLKYSHDGNGDLQPPAVKWGPYLGTGSPYDDPTYTPPGFGDLYRDVAYGDVSAPGYTHPPLFLDLAVDNRDSQHHYLFAALDGLGWCAFNLEAAWDELIFSLPDGSPDFIHEGKLDRYSGNPHPYVRLHEDPDLEASKRRTYARNVEVITTYDESHQNPRSTLAVGTKGSNFLRSPGEKNEGRVLSARLNLGPIPEELYASDQTGPRNYSIVYDLEGFTSWGRDSINRVGATAAGPHIHLFESQVDGELSFLAGNGLAKGKLEPPRSGLGSIAFNLSRVTYLDFPAGIVAETHDELIVRDRYHRPGRLTVNVAPSLADPSLLVTSSNDGGLVPGGPIILDLQANPPTIESPWFDVAETGVPPDDGNYRYSHGVVIDPTSGFVGNDLQTVLHEYRIGFGPCACLPSIPNCTCVGAEVDSGFRWRMVKNNPAWSLGVPQVEPQEVKRLFNMAPPTKFNKDPNLWETGRHYYTPTMVNEEYNVHVRTNFPLLESKGIAWSSLNGNAQGVWALRLSQIQGQLDAPANQNLDNFRLTGGPGDLALGALTTHPEFWNVDDVRVAGHSPDAELFIGAEGSVLNPMPNTAVRNADVQTWHSDLFKLPSVPGGPADRWVLAVASGFAFLSENNSKLVSHPTWVPHPPFQESSSPQGYGHMMIRLFDVTDPSKIEYPNGQFLSPNEDSQEIPGFTILGPDPDTTAYLVKGVTMEVEDGDDRYFLIVTDIGGRLYIYDIGGLLTQPMYLPPGDVARTHFGAVLQPGAAAPAVDFAPIKTYQATGSFSDGEPNFVSGLAVDSRLWSVNGGAEEEHLFIYLGVSRLGVEVLRFDLNGQNGQGTPGLKKVGIIQTPGDGSGLYIQEYGPNDPFEKLLFVGDYDAGFRIFGY